jgi:4-hydroxy-4-methyl-2-oxoglutarate aldolase
VSVRRAGVDDLFPWALVGVTCVSSYCNRNARRRPRPAISDVARFGVGSNKYTGRMPSMDEERGERKYRLSSDTGVGGFEPQDIREVSFPRASARQLDALRGFAGLTSTTSDVLDELGWRLSVPASAICPRHAGGGSVIGHALTLKYLPERPHLRHRNKDESVPKLAHHIAFRLARPGDVIVVDAVGCGEVSVMGGLAAASAVRAGVAAVIVDGAVRDVSDVRSSGLPTWSRYVTPVTGKERLEAISINAPIQCAGVQVRPGDIVIADDSGVCFVPAELADQVLERVLEVAAEDRNSGS